MLIRQEKKTRIAGRYIGCMLVYSIAILLVLTRTGQIAKHLIGRHQKWEINFFFFFKSYIGAILLKSSNILLCKYIPSHAMFLQILMVRWMRPILLVNTLLFEKILKGEGQFVKNRYFKVFRKMKFIWSLFMDHPWR